MPEMVPVTPHGLAALLPKTLPCTRIRYGDDSPVQFADLRLPDATPPAAGFPVILFVHGGAWLADWTKDYTAPFVEALTAAGFATWDVEFRRIGNSGGGYPGTFLDVARAADHLRTVARAYPLDLANVIGVGHSSGGHLALWLAARAGLPAGSALHGADPLRLKGVISIAGVNDLEHALEHGGRADILHMLGTGSASEAAGLFAETSPARLLPFGMPQALVVGTLEEPWRIAMTAAYARAAVQAGDRVELIEPAGLDHFAVVDPSGPAVAIVAGAARAMLG